MQTCFLFTLRATETASPLAVCRLHAPARLSITPRRQRPLLTIAVESAPARELRLTLRSLSRPDHRPLIATFFAAILPSHVAHAVQLRTATDTRVVLESLGGQPDILSSFDTQPRRQIAMTRFGLFANALAIGGLIAVTQPAHAQSAATAAP